MGSMASPSNNKIHWVARLPWKPQLFSFIYFLLEHYLSLLVHIVFISSFVVPNLIKSWHMFNFSSFKYSKSLSSYNCSFHLCQFCNPQFLLGSQLFDLFNSHVDLAPFGVYSFSSLHQHILLCAHVQMHIGL
jgi:hypothetical protein